MTLVYEQIVDEYLACSHCGKLVREDQCCCGEVHNEIHYEMASGDVVMESDVEAIVRGER